MSSVEPFRKPGGRDRGPVAEDERRRIAQAVDALRAIVAERTEESAALLSRWLRAKPSGSGGSTE